jgi:transposase-like protein
MVVLVAIKCPECKSDNIIRRGYTRNRTQRYLCQNPLCGRTTFILEHEYIDKGKLPATKEKIIDMALNGSGIRDTARVLGVSTTTVINTLKKRTQNSNV